MNVTEHSESGQYINPVVNADFPDPSVIYVEGDGYYAYATHDEFSPTINNILLRHSPDLVHWSEASGALSAPPSWAQECQKFWCPHVVSTNGQFRLYYAAEPDTRDGMVLAMAISNRPSGFIDSGSPMAQIPGSGYQMIDPCFFADPVSGKHLFYYGSMHQPIRAVELAPDGRTFISEPVIVLNPGEGHYHWLREGAFISYHSGSGRYYLWISGHNTWEARSYAISVYWANDPLAMFEKIPGADLLLQPNDRWDSPGQNCIVQDGAGDDWLVYHAVDTRDRYIPGTDRFLRKMCMDKIHYDADGWPSIAGGSASSTLQAAPVG